MIDTDGDRKRQVQTDRHTYSGCGTSLVNGLIYKAGEQRVETPRICVHGYEPRN